MNVLHLVIHLKGGSIERFEWITGCDGCEKMTEADVCGTTKNTFWSFDTKKEKTTENKYCSRAECTEKESECDLKVIKLF